jgi:hypothetical protein
MTKIPIETVDLTWKSLYRVGAVSALIAALIFRRNLGVAEIPLVTGIAIPNTAAGWVTLLHDNSLLGLTLLNVFDIANYALVGLMFLAVYVSLRRTNKSCTLLAAIFSFVGMVLYFVSNSALSMFSLSNQYAAATTDAQKSTLLAAGQTVLANGYDPSAVYQSGSFYLSLLFVALAGMLMSAVMLQSRIFNKATAYVGIAASALDLAYIVGLPFVPQSSVPFFGAICVASAGLLLMIWHLLVGIKLYKLSRTTQVKGGVGS